MNHVVKRHGQLYKNFDLLLVVLAVFFLLVIFGKDVQAATSKIEPTIVDGYTKDASTNFLAVIFGGVSAAYGGILGYDSSGALGHAFKVYNGFVSIVGAVMIMFITIVGAVNSANSGTPLGQKWHTLFLPARVTLGAGMLVPMGAMNYNLAQTIIMWFILTGVHGADKVWSDIVNYKWGAGSSGLLGDASPANLKPSDAIEYYKNVIVFAGCMGAKAADPSLEPQASLELQCLSARGGSVQDDCSNTTFLKPVDSRLESFCKGGLNLSFPGLTEPSLQQEVTLKLKNQVVSSIASQVKATVELRPGGNFSSKINDLKANPDAILGAAKILIGNLYANYIDLAGIVKQQLTLSTASATVRSSKEVAIKQGWIFAGGHYYSLLKQEGTIPVALGPTDITSKAPMPTMDIFFDPAVKPMLDTLKTKLGEVANNLLSNVGSGSVTVSSSFKPTVSTNKKLSFITDSILPLIEKIADAFLKTKELFGYPDKVDVTNIDSVKEALKKDPLKGISESGAKIIEHVEMTVAAGIAVLLGGTAVAIAGGAVTYSSVTVGVFTIIFSIFSAIISIMMIFFPMGVMHAMYVPLVPFIVYLFGALGWLLICVEAMAAGPIVAVGLMHPEGNEVLGKAEQGLNMILNLMLRPVLMVIGLLAGLVVVRVGCLFFSIMMNNVYDSGLFDTRWVTISVGLMFFYSSYIYYIVHESFSLINKVPDRVLSWIGASVQGVGDDSAFMSGAKQSIQDGGGVAGAVGGKVVAGAQNVAGAATGQANKAVSAAKSAE